MCVLDAVVLNVDRHLGNFGVMFNTDAMCIERMAPIYDHNRSLLFDLDQSQFDRVDWYIQKCKPRIGSDFISTAKGLLTDSIRNDLKNLRGFRFEQHETIHAEQWRLDKLSEVVNSQIEIIL